MGGGRRGRVGVAAVAVATLMTLGVAGKGGAQEPLLARAGDPDALRDAVEAAFRAKSAEDVAALFADGGVMVQGTRALVGPSEIRTSLAEMFGSMEGANPLSFSTDGVTRVPGMALDPGGFGPDGSEPVGRYLVVSEDSGDGWRIVWMRWYR